MHIWPWPFFFFAQHSKENQRETNVKKGRFGIPGRCAAGNKRISFWTPAGKIAIRLRSANSFGKPRELRHSSPGRTDSGLAPARGKEEARLISLMASQGGASASKPARLALPFGHHIRTPQAGIPLRYLEPTLIQ